jgi:hypothetical protein
MGIFADGVAEAAVALDAPGAAARITAGALAESASAADIWSAVGGRSLISLFEGASAADALSAIGGTTQLFIAETASAIDVSGAIGGISPAALVEPVSAADQISATLASIASVSEAARARDVIGVLGVLPPGITQTQSFSWVLREAMIAQLRPLFPGYTVRRNNAMPIEAAWQLPVLGVYLLSERMTPLGDWNAGSIRFYHEAQFGFQVIVANNDSDAAQRTLDACWWLLMTGLWANDDLTNLIGVQTADNTRIEGVTLANRRFVFGTVGKNNETPVAELQYEATCKFGSLWAPVPQDDLLRMVSTVIPSGFDPTQTQTITVEYDFTASG